MSLDERDYMRKRDYIRKSGEMHTISAYMQKPPTLLTWLIAVIGLGSFLTFTWIIGTRTPANMGCWPQIKEYVDAGIVMECMPAGPNMVIRIDDAKWAETKQPHKTSLLHTVDSLMRAQHKYSYAQLTGNQSAATYWGRSYPHTSTQENTRSRTMMSWPVLPRFATSRQ